MATRKADQISGNSMVKRNKIQKIKLETRNHPMVTRSKTERMKLAALFTSIPDEYFLHSEILTRLPVKSLLRFKSVDRSWLALITSEEFVGTHMANSRKKDIKEQNVTLITNDSKGFGISHCLGRFLFSRPFLSIDDFVCHRYVKDGHVPRIVGSCNGLVCLLRNREQFEIVNPSTRESRELPALNVSLRLTRVTICGFGYDEASNDYKVLAMSRTRLPPIEHHTTLYSLKTDSWKTIDGFLDHDNFGGIECLGGRGAYVNNKLHWMRNDCRKIVSFDLGTEAAGVIEPPRFETSGHERMDVTKGCLTVICEDTEVLALKEYAAKDSWCRVGTSPSFGIFGNDNLLKCHLCISENGTVMISDLNRGSSLYLYNSKTELFKRLKLIVHETSQAAFAIESLVSPFRHGN